MTDNLRPDVSNSVNTVFTEQRTVESQLAHPMVDMHLSPKVEAEMSEDTWYAKQQLMKPVQLAQIQWNTSQPRDTDIYEAQFPKILSSVESIVLRTLRMYAYFKISPCFRIQINSTQFHQGQLVCSFDPFTISNRTSNPGTALFDYIYATGLPNVKIMASESDAVELCVPFVHPSSFWTTNNIEASNFQDLGTLRITVLNPLVVAEGTSPNVTVTVWVYAKDASVHVPIFDHTPILDPSSIDFQATSGKKEKSKEPKSILSSLSNGVGSITKIAGNLATGNIGQALRSGQGLVDSLGDIFGFDYPARTIQPPKTISPVENLAVGIGESQSQRMAIDPFSLHVIDNEVAGESIESMDLLRIAQMPMLLSQFNFSGSQAQDTLLFSCPVTPTVSAFRNSLRRTYLSSVSNAFCYWNGGINFDIEVVATRFHSGKLLFAFVPNDVQIPSYASAADGLPNVIVDIQQTSSTRFKIPFVSGKPLKDVQRLNPNSSTDPSPDPKDPSYNDSCIGTLVCYVQNILNYASNVAPTVEVNMYISAGDDFGLYVPGIPLVDVQAATPQFVATSGTNEIGIDLNKNNTPTTAAVLTKGQLKSIPRKHFGEQYALIDIIRRFTPLLSDTLINGLTYSVAPVFPAGTDAKFTGMSYIEYFGHMYSSFCGSLRYKYVIGATRDQNSEVDIIHYPRLSQVQYIDTNYTSGGLARLRTNAQQDCAIELEVPYYSKYNMLIHNTPGNVLADLDFTFNGILVVKTNITADMNIPVDVYIAAGEDFRFIYLRPFRKDTTNVGYFVNTLA